MTLGKRLCSQCIYAFYPAREYPFPVRQCLLGTMGRAPQSAEQIRLDPTQCGPKGIYWIRKPEGFSLSSYQSR